MFHSLPLSFHFPLYVADQTLAYGILTWLAESVTNPALISVGFPSPLTFDMYVATTVAINDSSSTSVDKGRYPLCGLVVKRLVENRIYYYLCLVIVFAARAVSIALTFNIERCCRHYTYLY